MKNEVNFSS